MNVRLLAALLMSFITLQAAQVRAQETAKWRVGANYGIMNEKKFAYTKTDEGAPAGLEVARKLGEKFELGFSYAYAAVDYEITILSYKFGFYDHFFMLFGNYRMDTLVKGLYIGPQLGFVSRSLRKDGDNIGLDAVALGARAGYDYFLTERLSVGAQAQYVSVGKAEKTVTDDNAEVTYSAAATNFMQYLLSVNYRF